VVGLIAIITFDYTKLFWLNMFLNSRLFLARSQLLLVKLLNVNLEGEI